MKTFFKSLFVSFCLVLSAASCQKESDTIIAGENIKPPYAYAGLSQVIQGPVQMLTLTGTDSTKNGTITGRLWSVISGPNVPVIVRPSSAITNVSAVVYGTYSFQYMVIDSAGLSGVDTMTVQVVAPPIRTSILQPVNNSAELNFAGWASGGNLSSHQKALEATAWTNGAVFYTRGAFKFDLSQIPVGSTIISAKLSLYSIPDPMNGDGINANGGTNNAMFIQRITSGWNAGTATWGTQPGTTTADQVTVAHTNSPSLDITDMDVKNIVSAMVNTANNGFMMRLQNESIYNVRGFCSSVHINVSKHPKLVVVYQ